MTKNILKSKLTKPLKYKAKLQISIKDQNGSESSHNPKVINSNLTMKLKIKLDLNIFLIGTVRKFIWPYIYYNCIQFLFLLKILRNLNLKLILQYNNKI